MRSQPFLSLWKMRMHECCLSIAVCLCVCPAPRVLPLRATERPTEGTYGIGAIWNMAFSRFVQKVWRKKANKLTVTSYWRRWSDIFRRQGLFWFFQSLTAGYKLPGRVRQRATSLSAIQLSYTMFVNACAFSEPRARATAPHPAKY